MASRPRLRSRSRARGAEAQAPSAESFVKQARLVVDQLAQAPVLSAEAQETRDLAKTTNRLAAATLDQIVASAYNQENPSQALMLTQATFETELFKMESDHKGVRFYQGVSKNLTTITNALVFGQSAHSEMDTEDERNISSGFYNGGIDESEQ